MYHNIMRCKQQNTAIFVAALSDVNRWLFVFLLFALLVSYAAAGFAGGLAGSLAFAAAAVLRTFAKVTSF